MGTGYMVVKPGLFVDKGSYGRLVEWSIYVVSATWYYSGSRMSSTDGSVVGFSSTIWYTSTPPHTRVLIGMV